PFDCAVRPRLHGHIEREWLRKTGPPVFFDAFGQAIVRSLGMVMKTPWIGLALLAFSASADDAPAQSFKPYVLDPSYSQARWGTTSTGIVQDFRAYRSSCVDLGDAGFEGAAALGVPEWVA